jgi:hypothetical protein
MCHRRRGRDDCTKPTSVASGTDPYLLTHARVTGFKVRRPPGFKVRRPPPRTVSGSSPTTCSSSSARSERGRRKPRGLRPNCSSCPQDLSPRFVPRQRDLEGLPFQRLPVLAATATTSSPSGSGRCSVEPGNRSVCRHFAAARASSIAVPTPMRRCSVVLCQTTKIPISGDFFSTKALWRTRTADPPYHGGFGLRPRIGEGSLAASFSCIPAVFSACFTPS